MAKAKILVSGCLLGEKVRYDGGHCLVKHPILQKWAREGRLIPICPEVAGGLATPRTPAEIVGEGGGEGVLRGQAKVISKEGKEVSVSYLKGAEEALLRANQEQACSAILKEGSPSCGPSQIYDGTFSGKRLEGQGVSAALLRRHSMVVFSEDQLDEAARELD